MKHDVALLVVGLTRSGLWLLGTALAVRERRVLPAVGFTLAAANGVVFSLSNAHYAEPSSVVTLSVYVATPTVAIIVAAFLTGTHRYARSTRWRL